MLSSPLCNCDNLPYLPCLASIVAHSLQVKPWRTESDSSSQTGDRLIIHGEDLGSNRVLSWWDLLWQLNLLRDGGPALLDRALEIDVLDLLAQVCLGRENLDRAVLDLQKNICALFDFLLECARGFDEEWLSPAARVSRGTRRSCSRNTLRKRWVWSQVNLLNHE
jgi:hypothetical protein